jgi:hypothetical protein
MPPSSSYYPLAYKQQVVTYYTQHLPDISFRAVARLFRIKGGHMTVQRWYERRNSLETKQKSGRPTILSSQQINTHITKKIIQHNRTPTPIHYTQLLSHVKRATRKNLSLRTLRRYGKERGGVKLKRTIKRTEDECNITYISSFITTSHFCSW